MEEAVEGLSPCCLVFLGGQLHTVNRAFTAPKSIATGRLSDEFQQLLSQKIFSKVYNNNI